MSTRQPLTDEQQTLVLTCDEWLIPECYRCVPSWLRYQLGMECIVQEAWLAVCKAASDFDPILYPTVPFGAYARRGVRDHLKGVTKRYQRTSSLWKQMPDSMFDDLPVEIADYRRNPTTMLSLWCDEEYTRSRQALSLRQRIVLYLRIVESWTLREVAAVLKVSHEYVRYLSQEAANQLNREDIK